MNDKKTTDRMIGGVLLLLCFNLWITPENSVAGAEGIGVFVLSIINFILIGVLASLSIKRYRMPDTEGHE